LAEAASGWRAPLPKRQEISGKSLALDPRLSLAGAIESVSPVASGAMLASSDQGRGWLSKASLTAA
jgi:hypothetical protein